MSDVRIGKYVWKVTNHVFVSLSLDSKKGEHSGIAAKVCCCSNRYNKGRPRCVTGKSEGNRDGEVAA